MDKYRFRFWLESEQRWFYFGFETYLTYKDQIGKALDDGLKIYQFTGLKDKKGKEIFEGDIVKINEYEDPYTVTFDCGCFLLEERMANYEATYWSSNIEVIGNIREKNNDN